MSGPRNEMAFALAVQTLALKAVETGEVPEGSIEWLAEQFLITVPDDAHAGRMVAFFACFARKDPVGAGKGILDELLPAWHGGAFAADAQKCRELIREVSEVLSDG